jgi:hypothetical protein
MTYRIHGNDRGGAGFGSFALTRGEITADFANWLDRLRAGEFRGNEFTVQWDESDEPHVFKANRQITDERVCVICDDTEEGNAERHVPERRVTGSARR